MAREKGLSKQVQNVLDSKLKIGYSKYQDKCLGVSNQFIYSWSTYRAYLKHGCYFVKWARAEHGVKTLESAKPYINEFLQMRIDQGLSAYTQKLEASALAKIYGCSTNDFIKTETRYRANIVRSRGEKPSDRQFSELKNARFVEFCRATGLRRHELKSLTKDQLVYDNNSDTYYLHIVGKGGRFRESPILDRGVVQWIMDSEGELVWKKLPSTADIHSYRADYCTQIYKQYARPVNEIPRSERYCCKGELRGIWYDKKAMQIASNALGHNRISVIAGHYIRK